MENSYPNTIEKNSELLKIYLDKLQSNNLTILERNELLNLYTKKIAGDFGESKSFNDFIAQETKMEEESPIILFAKIVLNLFHNENKNISNLRDIWKLIEAGEVEIVLQYFLTIQNPDLLFCYYILIIYNIINFSENEISFNNINLVVKEIEKRVPLTQRKIFTMKYFSPKFISKLLFFLIINDISVKEIFKREKGENQFTLIKELVILTEEMNEDIIKFIYKLIPLTLLITELNYKSQVLSFIAKKVYFYDDIELAKSLFLKAESNVDYEKPNSYLNILIDCDLILDNELLFALLSRMIVNVKNFRADFLKSEVYSNLLEFIYKNIINTEVKLKLLELAAPNVNLYKDSYFKFFHYLHIGKLYTRINEKELALEFLEKATKEVLSVTRVFYRVGMYSTISFFYIELNEIQKTERIEELMLIELKKYSFPYDKMLNFYKMADFYLSIQEIQKAKFYIFKIKPILRKEKKYENIEIILQSSTPLVYKLQEMEYLHFLFTYWIKKIDELEKDSELKLKVIKLLIFINEKFDSSIFDEYFPRLNLMLNRSTFIDKSLINIVRKIKDANLKNTIWISITDKINLNKYLDSSNEFLTQLFYSFLDFKDDYNAGEVINVLLKKLEITKNLSGNLETLDIIAKLSLNFPPNEKLISIILNESKKIDSINSLEEKIFNLHFYFSIAESLDLMGKKENAKAMFQKEFIEQRISPDTLDTILTLKSLNDNCIKFGKKEEAIYILQKAIPIINERSTNITKPLLFLLFSNTLEVKYNFFKVLNILKEIIYSNKESILVLSDSIFEIIIKSICLLKNKHLAYYILKILDTMIQRTDYYDKKASVYFGYVSIEKIDDIEYKFKNLISEILFEDKRYSWKTPYLSLINKFSETKNPEILYFLLNAIFDLLSDIHSIKENDITDFKLDLFELLVHSKNKWIGEFSYSFLYIMSSNVNINIRVILNLYIYIFMEEREYEFYKTVFKVVNKHLPNVTNKKEIYPKIFNLIQFIKDPDHFKIIFRKLRKYYNNQYDKLEPFDLQHNLNMANSFYRQFNFNSADFYFNRAKGIARSSKESNFIALEISKILVSNREIQKEEFFKDLFLEYLDELQNSTYSGLKIESFTSVLPEILATENIKYLYYIEKFLNAHQEEIELTKNYKSILTSHISQKKETQKLFSFFLRSFLLGPFDEALVTEQLKALTKLLANFGYCKEAIEIFKISEFLLLPKTHT